MPLPKLATLKFDMKDQDGKTVRFRPFLVKEEKALLVAMESNDPQIMQQAILDVVEACFEIDDIKTLPYFVVERMFLNLRAKSVSEIVTLNYSHKGDKNFKGEVCEQITPVRVNLEKVELKYPDTPVPALIKLDDTYSIKLKYPTIMDVTSMVERQTIDEMEMIARCVVSVLDENEEYVSDSLEDTKRFISELTSAQYAALLVFFKNMPYLHQSIEYKCSKCGQTETIELRGLEDFFA